LVTKKRINTVETMRKSGFYGKAKEKNFSALGKSFS